MKTPILFTACAIGTFAISAPIMAQDYTNGTDSSARDRSPPAENSGPRIEVDPYFEASQIVAAELAPGDDVVTYTQLAAGVDVSATGRNNGGSASIRYERNIGYGDDALDSNVLTGVARGYASVTPGLTLDAGALASRTRVDASGGTSFNPVNGDEAESRIYSIYGGPTLATQVGVADVTANYRIGYTRVEAPDAPVFDSVTGAVDTAEIFDDSISQSAAARIGVQPGEVLPVGVGIGAGWNQEDISNLDQRVRDIYVRGDVTVPVSPTLAVIGGVGYEDVTVSSRDAVLDADGTPVLDDDGRFVTDDTVPRQIAYETSGLIWDAGVLWRPSNRTSLQATVGRRYDSMTYSGSFAWAPNRSSSVTISAYDAVTGFGGQLNNALANLPTSFSASRNALSGDFNGCVTGVEGGGCLTGALGSVRSAVFRNRGIAASYSRRDGRYTTSFGAGYDRRTFIAAPGTVLAAADGQADESYYLTAGLQGEVGRNASFGVNTYLNYFDSEFGNGGDLLAFGSSATYQQILSGRLSARAAVALDHIEASETGDDFTTASALLGLRYDF